MLQFPEAPPPSPILNASSPPSSSSSSPPQGTFLPEAGSHTRASWQSVHCSPPEFSVKFRELGFVLRGMMLTRVASLASTLRPLTFCSSASNRPPETSGKLHQHKLCTALGSSDFSNQGLYCRFTQEEWLL